MLNAKNFASVYCYFRRIAVYLIYMKSMKKFSGKKITAVTAIIACVIILGVVLGACAQGTSSSQWVADTISRYYYTDVEINDADSLSPSEIVSKYLDEYSAYYTAQEYAELLYGNAGNSVSYGAGLIFLPGEGAVVITCTGNSPAWKSGIRVGDVIYSAIIDGKELVIDSAEDLSAFTAATSDGTCTTFYLASGLRVDLEEYSQYKQSYVLIATNSSAWYFTYDGLTMQESASDAIPSLPDGTAYICLSEFSGDAATQFQFAAEKFNSLGCDTLILDLRSNPGGELDITGQIAACFENVAGKTLLTAKGKSVDDTYTCPSAESRFTIKSGVEVKVMANSGTASASEVLMGALLDYGVISYSDIYLSSYGEEYLALAGEGARTEQTYGKGCMQYIIPNSQTGEALRLTAAILYWPDGNCINDRGITKADGCNTVSAPYPSHAVNTEVEQVISAISQDSAAAAA